MAYSEKYNFTGASKSGTQLLVKMYEQDYVGDVFSYRLVSPPILQYIPFDDDPFSSVIASQVSIQIDVTDDLDNIPTLINVIDRFYHVEWYIDGVLYWSGWALSDNVTLPYTTGRKVLSFNCVDGLGMLQNIPLPIDIATNINSYNTCLYFIYTALAAIQLPVNLDIYTMISVYADGMDTRTDDPAADPLFQSYLPLSTFKDRDYLYINCLDVLRNICRSFGAQLRQSNGAWYLYEITQMAVMPIYYTQYDENGAVESGGTIDLSSTIQPYRSNTDNTYFVENKQVKRILKGYNSIEDNHSIDYAFNYFNNQNFRSYLVNTPTGWTTFGGTPLIIDNPGAPVVQFRLDRGGSGTATLSCVTLPYLPYQVGMRLGWTFFGSDNTSVKAYMRFWVVDDLGDVWIYSKQTAGSDAEWVSNPTDPPTNDFYAIPATPAGQDNDFNKFSITIPSPPSVGGQLKFALSLEDGTGEFFVVGDFQLQMIGVFRNVILSAELNDSEQYKKLITLPYGFNNNTFGDTVGVGVISLADGTLAQDWVKFPNVVTTFDSLAELVIQQYANVFLKNVINIEGSIMSIESTNGRIGGRSVLLAEDTDPTQISVSGKSFLFGNTTIDVINDIYSGTFLDIGNNSEASAEIDSQYFYNDNSD